MPDASRTHHEPGDGHGYIIGPYNGIYILFTCLRDMVQAILLEIWGNRFYWRVQRGVRGEIHGQDDVTGLLYRRDEL